MSHDMAPSPSLIYYKYSLVEVKRDSGVLYKGRSVKREESTHREIFVALSYGPVCGIYMQILRNSYLNKMIWQIF